MNNACHNVIEPITFENLTKPQLEIIETHRQKKLNIINEKINNIKKLIDYNSQKLNEVKRFQDKRRKFFHDNNMTSTTIASFKI